MPDIIPLDMPFAYWRQKAQQAAKTGNLREAARLYRAALRQHDSNALRRELAQVYADMRCMTASDRLYHENLAYDAGDADSLYGLARNRSLMGDSRGMSALLDQYLRMAPCGEQADQARDILWQQPREPKPAPRTCRAETLFNQAADVQDNEEECLRRAKKSWKRGHLPQTAKLLCQQYLRQGKPQRAFTYADIACRMTPRDMAARQLLATALHALGMPHACRAALGEAAALCDTMELLPLFCGCAISLEQTDLAVEQVEKWLARYPDSADLMLLLALTLREEGGEEDRVQALAEEAEALDGDNPAPRLLRDHPGKEDSSPARQFKEALHRLHLFNESITTGDPDTLDERLHDGMVQLMRLPLPGMLEMIIPLMMKNGDTAGLRMALTEFELPPMLAGSILGILDTHGVKLPVCMQAEGRMILAPQQPRPPYDPDLHDLIRRLLRGLPDSVPLDSVVREVPPLWRLLPVSAQRHCAQSRDGVWPAAFTACLLARQSASAAQEYIRKTKHPRRIRRAYMQLIRRSKRPYEVHRL